MGEGRTAGSGQGRGSAIGSDWDKAPQPKSTSSTCFHALGRGGGEYGKNEVVADEDGEARGVRREKTGGKDTKEGDTGDGIRCKVGRK